MTKTKLNIYMMVAIASSWWSHHTQFMLPVLVHPSIFFIVAMVLGNGAALPAIASLSSFLFSSSSSFSFANHIGNAMEIYNRIV